MKIKWLMEEVPRNDGRMLIISTERTFKDLIDNEQRGSIFIHDENEAVKWMKAIELVNSLPDLRE